MRKLLLLCLTVSILWLSCSTTALSQQPESVLFVGNSLTYVGNLPAVFSSLARANGHAVRSYMLVSPGGTLAERVAGGHVGPSLKKCGCTVLLLQERGGDLFGEFGPDALAQSKQAIKTLAGIGRAKGARVVLLGTYNSRQITHKLVVKEGAAAHAAGIPYIAVSDRLWRFHDAYPSLKWLRYEEGGHPGKALTLLEAILVYKQLYGVYPAAKAFIVRAPIYDNHSGLKPALRRANASPPNASTPREVSYSAGLVQKLLTVLRDSNS